jgi:hypothetical protein
VAQSVISPLIPTYAYTTPYITVAEFLAAPTALDTTSLITGGTPAQQTQALADAISRASSWIDDLCEQVLAATLDLDRGRYRINREGTLRIPLRYKPVLEVRSISIGARPSLLTPLSSLVDVAILGHGTIEVPLLGGNAFTSPALGGPYASGGLSTGSRPLVDVTYVNGWANNLTTTATAAGASSVNVNAPLGVYPGTILSFYDGANTEQVTVAANYIPNSSPILLANPTLNAHVTGTSLSNLPPRVKEAAILLTCAVIQSRGDDAIILDAMETPSRSSAQSGATGETIMTAKAMLRTLKRAW